MKKKLETQIIIHAPIEKVWKILSDVSNYKDWNPFIIDFTGELKLGNKVKVKLQPPGGGSMIFTPTILELEPNQKFTWLGHLFFPGLFDGRHSFELTDNHDGTVTFLHSESFSGILVSLFSKMIDGKTKLGFEVMNEKLKELAEA